MREEQIIGKCLHFAWRNAPESSSLFPLTICYDLSKVWYTEFDLLERWPLSLHEADSSLVWDLIIMEMDDF